MTLNENDPARRASRVNQENHQTEFSAKNEQTSQDKSTFVDALRLDFLCDLADSLAAKSVALRMACVEGDFNTIDNLFDCSRLLAKEFVRTRSEIHWDQIKLVGKDIKKTWDEMHGGAK